MNIASQTRRSVTAASFVLLAFGPAAVAQSPSVSGSATERVLADDLIRLPYTGVELRLIKLYDEESGESRRLALDERERPVDLELLMSLESETRERLYGRMHPALHERIAQSAGDEPIPVLIQFALEEQLVDKSELDLGLIDEATLGQRALESRIELEERALSSLGDAATRYTFALPLEHVVSGPFVQLALPPSALSRLARDERVAFVGLAEEQRVKDLWPTIPESLPTTRTNWAHTFSKGAGVRVAVLEDGQLSVPQGNFNVIAKQTTSGSVQSHMTMSLGIIGNRYEGSWQGYAPDASILMANAPNYISAFDWAKARSVDVVTMSWHTVPEEDSGALSSRDVYFDYVSARYPYPVVFTSAGNQAGSGKFASGKGYNFFGVGNVMNVADGTRCNDTSSGSSTWRDPISPYGHREIPEIAAPGSRHELLGADFGGTSCATPVTASIAALVICENSSLRWWPAAVRAVLLATANYQGGDGQTWSSYIDGKDGAGMVDAVYAVLAGRRRASQTYSYEHAHDYGIFRASSFPGGYYERTWKVDVDSTASRVRAALTWNSKTTGTSSVLDSDLDLWVTNPAGSLVAVSSSWDNNVELVDFQPATTGTYTIKVRLYGAPADLYSEFGIAFGVHWDCL